MTDSIFTNIHFSVDTHYYKKHFQAKLGIWSCYGSISSQVQIIFSFLLGLVMYGDECDSNGK